MAGGRPRAPVPPRTGTAAAVLRRGAGPPPAGAWAEAEPARGDRGDHRPRPGGGPGRRPRRRADAVRPHGPHPGRRHGRRPRAARGGAGGGDLPGRDEAGDRPPPDLVIPGEVFPVDGTIETRAGAPRIELEVTNAGDRPVQVGSHFHFAQANRALVFDREAAHGHRLDIAAGTAVRFEPGITRRGLLVRLARERYAQLYGPTTGDRVRLADTDLLIEVEEDRCGGPGRAGEEAVFGGGKVIRESMGQGRATRAEGAPDLVITGAVILDHWGIIKADLGVRDGRIVAIGKAGNPDTMDGVHPDL